MDWKKKIDTEEERQATQAQQAEEEKRRLVRIEAQKRQAVAERERQNAIRKLGETFRCHVCKRSASKPETHTEYYTEMDATFTERSYSHEVEDRSRPGDLFRCTKCHNWTCEEHLYKGICQTCGEKL